MGKDKSTKTRKLNQDGQRGVIEFFWRQWSRNWVLAYPQRQRCGRYSCQQLKWCWEGLADSSETLQACVISGNTPLGFAFFFFFFFFFWHQETSIFLLDMVGYCSPTYSSLYLYMKLNVKVHGRNCKRWGCKVRCCQMVRIFAKLSEVILLQNKLYDAFFK